MNTLKATNVVRGRPASLSEGDAVGLLSDVLEPSPRYVLGSVKRAGDRVDSSHVPDKFESLSELRMPKLVARIGFSEFLD